ncbi:MAG: TauD/TfdA family dioxygenase [Pseudonocardiales bacterium]|nr:TauD/TfdA family dioxygenase [Pseudonocardiales bacterium]
MTYGLQIGAQGKEEIEISRHGMGQGLLISAHRTMEAATLEKSWILRLVADGGYLVLRGFSPSIERFSALVRSVCSRTMLDPAREFSAGMTVQKVDIGTGEIGLHVEHGTNPLTPHLTWFFCRRAARKGSQTTVCDGYRVWDALSVETRRLFRSNDIAYSRNIEEAKWRALASYLLGGAKRDDEITVDDIVELAKAFGDGFQVKPNDDGSIYYVYRVPAAHATLFGTRLAFANSILGPSYHYEKPRITFADGTLLPGDVIAEIDSVSSALIEEIDWQDGDIAIIDNTRVMHGRRAVLDPERREIFVALGYVDSAMPPA